MIKINKAKMKKRRYDIITWRLDNVKKESEKSRKNLFEVLSLRDESRHYINEKQDFLNESLLDLIKFSLEVIENKKADITKLEKRISYEYIYIFFIKYLNTAMYKNNPNIGGYESIFLSKLAFVLSTAYIFNWKSKSENIFKLLNKKNIENNFIILSFTINRISWFIFRLYAIIENKKFNISELDIDEIKDIENDNLAYHPNDMGELWKVLKNWDTENEEEVKKHIELMARDREENNKDNPWEATGDEYEFVYFPVEIFMYLKARKNKGLKNPKDFPYELLEYYDIDEILEDREPYKEDELILKVRKIIKPLLNEDVVNEEFENSSEKKMLLKKMSEILNIKKYLKKDYEKEKMIENKNEILKEDIFSKILVYLKKIKEKEKINKTEVEKFLKLISDNDKMELLNKIEKYIQENKIETIEFDTGSVWTGKDVFLFFKEGMEL